MGAFTQINTPPLLDKEIVAESQVKNYIIRMTEEKDEEIAITDHHQQKPGWEMITDDLILELLKNLNGKRLRPIKYSEVRKVCKWEIIYQNKKHHLIFWFINERSFVIFEPETVNK